MRIFISYRRGSSSGWAGRLAEKLKARFGPSDVFMDIETLQPGVDFVEAISSALKSSDVLLTIIGPDWIGSATSGRRRLDDPSDFVRIEIASALSRGVRVIPVLVGGATMPTAADLPEDLQSLARRQAHELSDTRWDFDCQRLIAVLSGSAEGEPGRSEKDSAGAGSGIRRARRGHLRRMAIPIMIALVVLFAGGFLMWRFIGGPPQLPTNLNTQTFAYPTLEGYRVDVCLSWGVDCGKPAADEFCKRQGYAESNGFETEIAGARRIRTKLIGTGQICGIPECAAFTRIECHR